MQDARWLFFDLGNTLISEERAWERRIQRLASSLERYRRRAIEEVRAALREASEEFAPRLITRAIEKLIDDLEYRKLILAEAWYDKELESPYEGAEQTLRTLSSRYRIGVIANQSAGTEERLTKWGLMPFISICLSSTEVGLEKPDPSRAARSAATIAAAYIAGGLIPLAPYIAIHHDLQRALIYSVVLTLLALFIFGWIKGRYTGVKPLRGGIQTVLVGGLAAAAAFFIARLISGSALW